MKQIQTLRAIQKAFEASLKKEDRVSTVEMLLLHKEHMRKIFAESPLSVLNRIGDIANYQRTSTDIIQKAWKIADLHQGIDRISWYLLIAWYFDSKNRLLDAKETNSCTSQ